MPICQIGDEKCDRIGKSTPGEDLGDVDAADLHLHGILDEKVGCRDDRDHGGSRHQKTSEHDKCASINRLPAGDRGGAAASIPRAFSAEAESRPQSKTPAEAGVAAEREPWNS